MPKKIESVIELARYRAGDIAWWVIIRPEAVPPEIPAEDEWMKDHHPKVLYARGVYRHLWSRNLRLPKLQHRDFENVVNLLRSKVVIEKFHISDVIRSRDTGEFFYSNGDDEWMPESYLFDSDVAARRERGRIMKLMRKWAT